jgi:MraZ protein
LLHPVLYGEHELIIDDKCRVLIAADIRRLIVPSDHGSAWFVVRGINKVPWFYNQKYYESLVNKAPQEMTPAFDRLAFDQLNFARASMVEPDKQGRLVMPEKLLRRCEMGKGEEVTLIGVRDHLELWKRAAWDAHCEQLEAREAEITAFARAEQQAMNRLPTAQ